MHEENLPYRTVTTGEGCYIYDRANQLKALDGFGGLYCVNMSFMKDRTQVIDVVHEQC